MKYLVAAPQWCKLPVKFVSELFDVHTSQIEMYGDRLFLDGDIFDISVLENEGFIIDPFDDDVITIAVDGRSGQIVNYLDEFLLKQIDSICSFKVQNYEFIQRHTGSKWDGVKHFFKKKSRKFDIGLLWRIKTAIERFYKGKRRVEVLDDRPEPEKIAMPDALTVELYPYQLEAVDKAIEMGSGLINIAIRGGKTIVAMEIMRRLEVKTAIVVPRLELLDQIIDELKLKLGIQAGRVGGGVVDVRDITVFMVQTIANHLKPKKLKITDEWKLEEDLTQVKEMQNILNKFHNVIFDECHIIPARTFYTAGSSFDNAKHFYGLTATAFRNDNQDIAIFACVGDIIYKITASELIELGYLVPPTIKFIDIPKGSSMGLNYSKMYKQYVVENETRTGLLVEEIMKLAREGRKILVLVEQIEQGKRIQKHIEDMKVLHSEAKEMNLTAVFVRASGKGAVTPIQRKKIKSDFKAGKIGILIATSGIYGMGVDIPICDALVIAGCGKSKVAVIQRLRCLTPFPGKKDAIVIDTFDQIKWLRAQSIDRMEIYRSEPKFNVVRM